MSADVGSKAPAFKLMDTDGNEFSSETLAGKPAVLVFFPAAFTGVCAEELCSLRDEMADFNGLSANIVGISVDGRFANAAFKSANDLNFPILSDYQHTTINDYDIAWPDFAGMTGYTAARRSVFVVDANGSIAWKWLSDVPSDLPDLGDVKAAVEAL